MTLATSRGERDEAARKGVAWLLDSAGVESNFKNRTEAKIEAVQPGAQSGAEGLAVEAGDLRLG